MNEEICRLCLVNCPEDSRLISDDNENLRKIRYLLSLDEYPNEFLPKRVCLICTEEIDRTANFLKRVTKNQLILLLRSSQYFDCKDEDVTDNADILEDSETFDDNDDYFGDEDKKESSKIDHQNIPKDDEFELSNKSKNSSKYSENHYQNRFISEFDCSSTESKDNELNKSNDDCNNSEQLICENVSENIQLPIPIKKEQELYTTECFIHKNATNQNKSVTASECQDEDMNNKNKIELALSVTDEGNIFVEEKHYITTNETTEHYSDMIKTPNENLRTTENNVIQSDPNDEVGNVDTYVTKHQCLTCLIVLNSHEDLLNHYNTQHKQINENKKLKYNKYNVKVGDKNQVQFKCVHCDKTYDSVKKMYGHTYSHVTERPFMCKICGRTFKTVTEIMRHGRAHNGVKLTCNYGCGYSTVYKGALTEHIKRHKAEFKYNCTKCDKKFLVKTSYDEHQNLHNNLKPFVCDTCGLSFHLNKNLQVHRSNVHASSSKEKKFICIHCDLPFDSKVVLTKHLKLHGINPSKKSPTLCDVCGKKISSPAQMKRHKKVHLGIKHPCSYCNKSFGKKCNLKLHLKTHTKEQNYQCSICYKRYAQNSTLLQHEARHHPEFRKCSICQKKFKTEKDLGEHRKNCIKDPVP